MMKVMKILFVCTGNICRSAAAECILRKKLSDKGLKNIEVASARVYDLYGANRDKYMNTLMKKRGYSMGGKSVYLSQVVANDSDLIFGFTERHVKRIHELVEDKSKVYLFMDYCFGKKENVADPHFQSDYIYNNTIDIIEGGIDIILEKIFQLYD